MPKRKVCTRCQIEFPLGEFRIDKRRGKPKAWCRDCERAYQREYARSSSDYKARKAAWMQERRRDPEMAEQIRQWQRNARANGGAERERASKRRRKEQDFFGYHAQFARRFNKTITAITLRNLWDAQAGRCGITGQPLDPRAGFASLDHIVPQRRGGTHDLSNLRWVHPQANLAKRDMLDSELVEFARGVIATLA